MKNLMCLLFLLLFCFSINLEANSPIIIPNFPQSGQENIAINSKISFHTNYEIDTSSLIHLSPIQNFYVNDTVFVEKKYAQIMLIRKEYYQNVPDSLHYIYATEGSITTNSDNITINFNIHSLLDYETEYTLVVKDLFVIKPDTTQPSGYDTLAIDTTIVDFFKTTEVPIQLVSTSIDDREYQVLAGENLELLFSKKFLSSDLTNHNIATLAKVIDTVYVDSVNYYYVLDTVSTQRTLALDSTKIILNPDSLLELGKSYILSVDLKNVYGEYQPFFKEFWVKNYAKITLITRASYYDPDTNVVTDLFGSVYYEPDFDNAPLRDTVDNSFMGIVESQDVIYYPGTEFLARVPVTTPNDFYFVGFECPEDSSLNANYEDNTISVALTNTNLMDRTIIAKYNLAEDLQIELPFNVNIRGYDNLVCTKDSTIVYSFKNLPYREVTIFPQFTSGVPFLEWTSNDPEYDGSSVPCLSIPSSPKFDLSHFNNNPWRRGFKINWDEMYTPCLASRYKVELYYNHYLKSDYNNKSLEFPLDEVKTKDIITSFQVININNPLEIENVNINTLGATTYYGISQVYDDQTHNQKIIKFEISEQYKDIYEISWVRCISNGIYDGCRPIDESGYVFNDLEPIGQSWEHEIENKNLKIYGFGASTSCLEEIIVGIRRKLQKLTIEREMSDGSHVPTNLIQFQLRNSDDTAPIEYLEYKTPEKVTVDNEDGGKDITNFKTFYAIPSGVAIRIVPECKENSGYSLDEWKCDDDYTCTDVLPTYEKPGDDPQSRELVLSTTMNQDRTVCMLSDVGFRLERVDYYKRYEGSLQKFHLFPEPYIGQENLDNPDKIRRGFLPETIDYNDGFGLCWEDLAETDYRPNQFHKKACIIYLAFTKPVDKQSLENGLTIKDEIRLDGISNQTYHIKFLDEGEQGIYGVDYNAIARTDKLIEILLINTEDQKKWAPHYARIIFNFSNSIHSKVTPPEEPEYLVNHNDVSIQRVTALPGMKILTKSFYCGEDDLFLRGDPDVYIWGMVAIHDGEKNQILNDINQAVKDKYGRITYAGNSFRFPDEKYQNMEQDSWWEDDRTRKEIFVTTQLKKESNIGVFFHGLDENAYGMNTDLVASASLTVANQFLKGGGDLIPILKDLTAEAKKMTSGDTGTDDRTIGSCGFTLKRTEKKVNKFSLQTGQLTNYQTSVSTWGQSILYVPEEDYSYQAEFHSICGGKIYKRDKFVVYIRVELGDFGD